MDIFPRGPRSISLIQLLLHAAPVVLRPDLLPEAVVVARLLEVELEAEEVVVDPLGRSSVVLFFRRHEPVPEALVPPVSPGRGAQLGRGGGMGVHRIVVLDGQKILLKKLPQRSNVAKTSHQ